MMVENRRKTQRISGRNLMSNHKEICIKAGLIYYEIIY